MPGEFFHTKLSPEMVLRMIGKASFREFEQPDWIVYQGCTSNNPLIGEIVDSAGLLGPVGVYTIILDGTAVNIIHEDDGFGGITFELKIYE